MKAILLIMIGLSSLSMAQEAPRFTKADGVVTDSKTTLEWQDNYSDNGKNIKYANWTDAIDYCEELSLNSQNDWRLPNKKELLSIVDYGTFNPAISSVFKMTTSSVYWSSTTNRSYTDRGFYVNFAWYVNFGTGHTNIVSKSRNYSVRCVRAGLRGQTPNKE